ncbi:MAG: short-chain dehydrogenase [Ignavibacteriae bacterium]|nr:short-chain dehydrogenase [Ignavibacteriota bacterium]
MDIQNKKILILGGWGLVGSAIARRIAEGKPGQVILTSLQKQEAIDICQKLNKELKKKNLFIPWWGNIFVRREFKDVDRSVYLNNSKHRRKVIGDTVDELSPKMLRESSIYCLLSEFKPDIIIDCINTATAIAYQNIYKSYSDILKITDNKKNRDYDELLESVEKMMCSSYIPQLIRHVQLLYNSMIKFDTKYYFKVGTSGTGGMGLNIPFTHSEEKPSRVLLSKSSIAGAQTLLLFLMARTPKGPMIKEVKPTASIAWKKITYGEIRKKSKPIELFDYSMSDAVNLGGTFKLDEKKKRKKRGTLKTVYIDTGENGIFSRGEFEAITTNGQMEFVTPEEIAENIYRELIGGNTGNDIISALDSSAMEPSYRAGFLQHSAVAKIKELELKNKTWSVAFEMLGPPRLSKLLYEAHLIKLCYKDFNNFINESTKNITAKIFTLLAKDAKLRSEIISLGLPILFPDGKKILRGKDVIIPALAQGEEIKVTSANAEKWAHDGWVDLREANWKSWKHRFVNIMKTTEKNFDSSFSSRESFNNEYWDNYEDINIGKIVGWIFINEEKGLRMKG